MTGKIRRWLWVDLETTGLGYEMSRPQNYREDVILEVAAIITDAHLNEISVFGPFPVRTSKADLRRMDDFVRNMHTETGLLEQVDSPAAQPLPAIDQAMATWMGDHGLDNRVTLAGSSVKFDFEFLRRHMPGVFSRLGYRVIDVSTFKEALRDWHPQVVADIEANKASSHKAMEDIRASLHELRTYRQALGLADQGAAA
ncbi:oligoribonuclease [Pseudactinotalea sp. Z1748]|uniref:oligoribonuclease n=1 Tax=Pseudactinotalea sp. Z1748 TaxID=3413027 RepID=UPI003C7AE201